MAKIEPMTLDDIQREIHALYQNGIDVPVEGDEDYTLRTTFINNAIGTWEHTPGVDWRELYDIDNSKTFTGGPTFAMNCPPAYKEIAGKVRILMPDGRKHVVTIYEPENLDYEIFDQVDQHYGYVSGTPGAYKINFVNVQDDWIGGTIVYRYYHYAARMTAASDVPDMSDPHYLAFIVAARLHQLGRNNTGYTVNFDDAQEALKGMVVRNNGRAMAEADVPIGQRIKFPGIMGL